MYIYYYSKHGNDIKKYEEYILKVEHSRPFMPFLENLEDYETINCYYKYIDGIIYRFHTINLIIDYHEEIYAQKKQEILGKYYFLNKPMPDSINKGEYYIPEPEFIYNNYTIKVVEDQDFSYSRWFGMIGYNDDDYNLSYLFFYGVDNNHIKNSIDFMEECFSFE